jgi:cytoskeletal protein CcmA (bactofilin family)
MTRRSIAITRSLLVVSVVAGIMVVREPGRSGPLPVSVAPALAASQAAGAGPTRPTGVPAAEVIDRDYFAAGPLVEISGTVNGDVYAAGGQVLVDGRVNGDVLVVGGRVMLSGQVTQDVRVAGGQVSLSGTVGRNLAVLGGNVELTPGAAITGSLVAAGGNVHLAAPLGRGAKIAAGSLIVSNRIGGDVEAAVGALRISSKAEIKGRVDYVSRQEATVDPGARIDGPLTRRLPPALPRPSPAKAVAVVAALGVVIIAASFVSTLALGLLSMRFLPTYHRAAVSTLRDRPWAALGVGLVAALVTPVVGAMLFATVLGIPLAVIVAGAYVILLYWGRIFALHRLGEATCRLVRVNPRPAWVFLLGLVVYYLLALIPIIGWLAMLLVVLSGLGAELMVRRDVYVAARNQEMI